MMYPRVCLGVLVSYAVPIHMIPRGPEMYIYIDIDIGTYWL